ncbi:MAG: SRPBCC family protein [Alphaproteobacteria bacterium]
MPESVNSARAVREGQPEDRTLVVERVFRASPERVFQAWTDPAILARWWGPEGMSIPECEMDVRPGGAWSTVMANDEGMRLTVSGVYREITPPERLVMTWGWHQEDGSRGHETEIEVTLEDAPEGTRMRLVQSVFTSLEDRDNHNQGWQSTFNKLDLVLA